MSRRRIRCDDRWRRSAVEGGVAQGGEADTFVAATWLIELRASRSGSPPIASDFRRPLLPSAAVRAHPSLRGQEAEPEVGTRFHSTDNVPFVSLR